jgi:hypothetical protein
MPLRTAAEGEVAESGETSEWLLVSQSANVKDFARRVEGLVGRRTGETHGERQSSFMETGQP